MLLEEMEDAGRKGKGQKWGRGKGRYHLLVSHWAPSRGLPHYVPTDCTPSPGGRNRPEWEKGKQRLRKVAGPTSVRGKPGICTWDCLPHEFASPSSAGEWSKAPGRTLQVGGTGFVCSQRRSQRRRRAGRHEWRELSGGGGPRGKRRWKVEENAISK